MKDGKVTTTFVDGDITGVSMNVGLDFVYERLFKAAEAELQGVAPPLEASIRLIVFGCFWLEAVCNETVRDLLRATVRPDVGAEAIWEVVERSKFSAKLSIVAALAKTPDHKQAERVAKELDQVFGLRNRLAHFKDKETQVAGAIAHDEFETVLRALPEPDLAVQLKPALMGVRAQAVANGIAWLKEVSLQHFA